MRPAAVCGALAAFASLALAVSCGPIDEPAGSGAPLNACPEHPCSAYSQGPAASCSAEGACTAGSLPAVGIEVVIAIPQDSSFAPSTQYVVPFGHLGDCAPPQNCTCDGVGADAGSELRCAHLPALIPVSGAYVMSACVQSEPKKCASGLGFFLGNSSATGGIEDTWVPVHTTYRLLEDAAQTDVVALGLPLQPLVAEQTVINPSTSPGVLPGPYAGPSVAFQAQLPPGTYERTIAPDPAYDSVFGRDVHSVPVPGRRVFESVLVDSFDVTYQIPEFAPQATLPTFDISRTDGLDGWTALLRDAKTKRVLSNVEQLSGKLASGVRLVTRHLSASIMDALSDAELVVAPPLGAPIPTGVFAPIAKDLPKAVGYPPLPPPVMLAGKVTGPGGAAIAADLVFEALAFSDPTGVFKYPEFEFVGRVSTRPGADGSSSYSVLLPPGPYRVDVRPLDGSVAMSVTSVEVDAARPQQDFALAAPVRVRGLAALADGRPLAAATVEAIALPQGCFTPSALADGGLTGQLKPIESTPWCLPRPQQAPTNPDGSFTLPLDPGGYRIRVQPAAGTGLPWASTVVQVGDVAPAVNLVVPAPYRSTFKLLGADGSPISRAVVRAFSGSVEVAQTLTDVDGTCDLLVALPP